MYDEYALTPEMFDKIVDSLSDYELPTYQPLLCAPHQLFLVNWTLDLDIKGTYMEQLKQAKKKYPNDFRVWYAWRLRKKSSPAKPASERERFKAKHRRQFKQFCYNQEKEFGEYWDYDIDRWEEFEKWLGNQ
jgi:hypothetical protein